MWRAFSESSLPFSLTFTFQYFNELKPQSASTSSQHTAHQALRPPSQPPGALFAFCLFNLISNISCAMCECNRVCGVRKSIGRAGRLLIGNGSANALYLWNYIALYRTYENTRATARVHLNASPRTITTMTTTATTRTSPHYVLPQT